MEITKNTLQLIEFDKLSVKQLYQILKLRIDVFMIEQNCLYSECDDKDLQSKHLFLIEDNICIAYARLLPPNISFENCSSIGRVAVHSDFRKRRLGKILMTEAIKLQLSSFPKCDIRISAQVYLDDFYSKLGFQKEGDQYLEDGIPHVEMVLVRNSLSQKLRNIYIK